MKILKLATGEAYISRIYSELLIFPYPPRNNYCLEYTPMFERFRKGGGAKILKKEIALLMMIWNRKWKYSCRKIMYSIDLFQYFLYS